MRQIIILLMLISAVFAYSPNDYFEFVSRNVDITEACTEYNIINPEGSELSVTGTKSLQLDSWDFVTGSANNVRIEMLHPETIIYDSWQSNVSCENVTQNKTTTMICSDNGYYEEAEKTEYSWKPYNITSLKTAETKRVRICADIERELTEDGYSVRIDHVPEFNGYVFDGIHEYGGIVAEAHDWWNNSWGTYASITLTEAWSNGTYLLDNETFWDDMNCTADRRDVRLLYNNATLFDMWNQTNNWTWVEASGNLTIDAYCNNTDAVPVYNGENTFPWFRNISNCQENWTNHSSVLMKESGNDCWIDMNNPAGSSEYGYYTFDNIDAPFEYRTYAKVSQAGASAQMQMVLLDGSLTDRFAQRAHSPAGDPDLSMLSSGAATWEDLVASYSTTEYYIIANKINSTHDFSIAWNSTHEHKGNYTGTHPAGSPAELDEMWFSDLSGLTNSNDLYMPWQFIRYIQENFSEPTVSYSAPVAYVAPADSVTASLTSPANATRSSNDSYTLSYYCNGTFDSYLANVTIDGSVVDTNEPVVNATLEEYVYSASIGNHTWNVTCANDTTTDTSGTWEFERYEEVFAGLINPVNGSNTTSSSINLQYQCNGTSPSYFANVTVNGTVVDSDESVLNATTETYVFSAGIANHTWNVTCWNSTVINNSVSWEFERLPTTGIVLVSLDYPDNASITANYPVEFRFRCYGDFDTYNANLTVNQTNYTVNDVANFTIYIYNQTLDTGYYVWNITCWNSTILNISATALFQNTGANFSTINVTFTPDDIDYSDFITTTEDFFEDYSPFIIAIFSFGIGFLVTRKIPATMITGSIGLITAFFLTGNMLFLAGSIIALVIGFVYKQGVG